MIKQQVYCVLFLLNCFSFFGQIAPAFIKHLSENNLKTEHFQYLKQFESPGSDSLHFYRALYYLQYRKDDHFMDEYKRSSALFGRDTAALNYATCSMLLAEEKQRILWFDTVSVKSYYGRGLFRINLYAERPLLFKEDSVPYGLVRDFYSLRKVTRKSPIVASGLSAIIPGLGQLYIGKPKSFAYTLMSNAFFGLQSYESIKKLGIRNPLSIINAGALGVFYLANIYGSYKDTQRLKKERKKQVLIDAYNYYYTGISDSVYR